MDVAEEQRRWVSVVCGPLIGMRSAKYPECALTTTAHGVSGRWRLADWSSSSYFSHMKDKKYSVAYVTNKFIHLGLTSGERGGGVRDLVYCI